MSESVSAHSRHIVYLMMLGNFVASMNQTMLGPLLPSIMEDLHINAVQGQWLTTIYLLINGIMIPCSAYLSSRFTTKGLFITAMGLFTTGTVVAGLANSFAVLILARIFQALAFGILMPLTMSTLLIVYPRSQHGRAMGMLGVVIAAAPAIGPSLAGWIVDRHDWNTVFFCVVPLLLADILLSYILMHNLEKSEPIPLDLLSVVLSSAGFGSLLYGISSAGNYGWLSAHTIGMIIIGAVITTFFIRRQLHLDNPLLQVRVFANAQFSIGTFLGMCVFAALLFGGILTPIYLQQMHGYTAFQSALIMLPAGIISIFVSPVVGWLYDRYGARYLILFGLGLLTVGSMLYATFQLDSSTTYLVCIYTLRIVGINATMMPVNTWSMRKLDNHTIPHGTACNNTLRQIAGSVGTAFFISIYALMQPFSKATDPTLVALFGIHCAFFLSGVLILIAFLVALVKVRE